MDVRYLLLLFLLVGCLPESAPTNLSPGRSSTPGTNNSTDIPASETQWNYLGALSKSITINVSNLNNSYIVGKNIESYLNIVGTSSNDYCLISRFSIDNIQHEIRSRVVPISYYDFSSKRTVKILRVDFNDLTNSETICVGSTASPYPIKRINVDGVLAADPQPTAASKTTYNPAQLCTTCTRNLSSSKIFFTKKGSGVLEELTLAQVNLTGLSLYVDPNNSTTGNNGTCSNTECVSRGFDCCLDNQCISDGSVRPSAQTLYSSQLQAAEQERFNNPLAYLNYPHLYYICGSTVPSDTGGSGGGSYEQGLTQLMKDYYCVEHMKNYKTGATFHQDVLSGVSFFPDEVDIPDVQTNASTLYPTDIECRNNTDPSSDMFYEKVVERLYQTCGCSKTTLNEMIQYCPAYEYEVNYFESTGLPNRIDCYTPPNNNTPVPTQQSVSVNSRSAPHRYFRTCGDEFGSTTPCATGDEQEGDTFIYQDEGKILPIQEPFGMNSILGQMTVALDKALPAKAVDVELDQVYQLSTISGFYTPCPSCGKDSWFASFSAHPTSAYGTGLQAVGHTTERDTFGFNSTGGNYEDTIFGRACWIPPTMIPFTHYVYSTTQTQRLNRLKTQAALYANGYQRDWYGFNKGALIGSFDGVTWFAIGKGRIVRSTSTKLYLAINAPFADLASPTLHVVNVQAYDGVTQAAQVDYDPQYHLSHPYQNEAGNCQANHFCSTDTDCITRLGWEYMCADVQELKTRWPQFDTDANEVANASSTLTIDQILQQKRFPSSSTKRCVYRGAGALCIPNTQTIANLNKRKTLTCAPNFYCANVNSGSVFNNKVARYAANLEDIPVVRNHFYGKDANVLGRPLSYLASSLTSTLPTEVRTALTQNLIQYESTATSTTGLCLPGKNLPQTSNQTTMFNPYEQHKSADSSFRTDYIGQVGSCNSGLFSAYRYSSCPVINSDGDYEFLTSTFSTTNYQLRARNQNSCGLDSLLSTASLSAGAEALSSSSPFRSIEGKTLNNTTIVEPVVARDACLRRAGQVCHTNLDCGPNKMHADQVDNFSLSYFGNEAEKKYYSEYLVCSQEADRPTPGNTTEYRTYNMNKNKCCREIGSDLTTYTSYVPLQVYTSSTFNTNASVADDHYDKATFGLKVAQAPGLTPNDPYRYSRLATVENLGTTSRPPLNAFQDRDATTGAISSAQSANVLTQYQWKTLSEANSESCCGGGWIRKFSDGTNDWSRRDRVYLDVTNFKCINSRSVMLTKPADVAAQYGWPVLGSISDAQSLANADLGDYCKDSTGDKGSCAQYTIPDSLTVTPPTTVDPIVIYDGMDETTHYKTYGIVFGEQLDYYFYPRSIDSDSAVYIDYSVSTARRNISIKIPSFITRASWDFPESLIAEGSTAGTVEVRLYNIEDEDNAAEWTTCTKRAAVSAISSPTQVAGVCAPAGGSGCCYHYDPITRRLKVVPEVNAANQFSSIFPGQTRKLGVKLMNVLPAGDGIITRTQPGTSSYYLKHLGKLELSGIPQITYEKLTCSDNSDRIVPGLFEHTSTDMRVSDFDDPTYSFRSDALSTTTYTNYHALQHEPVFSANDFKCCTPLGKSTKDRTKCCSGTGTLNPSGLTYTCELPTGTDLMVYFNSFVSNEGRSADEQTGALTEDDFDPLTGEPLLTAAVTSKITALGKKYCQTKNVRQGGAFGAFKLEPYGNDTNDTDTIYGILDSSRDEGQVSTASGTVDVGYTEFMSGFRWNHHLYCDE